MSLIQNKIGVIGGLGPFAGVDITKKIIKNTNVSKDQDHISTVLLSYPALVEDRTNYIINKTGVNPSVGIIKIIEDLILLNVTHFGIACNTAHSPEILNPILNKLSEYKNPPIFINMVEETLLYIHNYYPNITRIGLMASAGTYASKVYFDTSKKYGLEIVYPSDNSRALLHDAIYCKDSGLKKDPSSRDAVQKLKIVLDDFRTKDVEAILLACTELPLAISSINSSSLLIDPGEILARKLVEVSKI